MVGNRPVLSGDVNDAPYKKGAKANKIGSIGLWLPRGVGDKLPKYNGIITIDNDGVPIKAYFAVWDRTVDAEEVVKEAVPPVAPKKFR